MERSTMIKRVTNLANNGGKCILMCGPLPADICKVEVKNDPTYGRVLVASYFDEDWGEEDADPFDGNEFLIMPDWAGVSAFVDACIATCNAHK